MTETRATAPIDRVRLLARCRFPSTARSALEPAVVLVPFPAIFALASRVLPFSTPAVFGLAVLNAGFLVRPLVIRHDRGRGSCSRSRNLSDWTGRRVGVLTLTPDDVWRRTHAFHHAGHGNLERRGKLH
ncbi:hypothetical protein [Albidovulum sp.]|uniref:hypothetical protein n=1 Tax=Albidovulum sp. TaxID=1872424 RepID=UPI003529B152